MKIALAIAFLFISIAANAQRFALIDTKAKLPILYTDSVSVEQIKSGYLPIEKQKLDTFLANLNYITKLLNGITRSKMESFELRNGGTTMTIERVPFAYGDKYLVKGVTVSGELTAKALITDLKHTNKQNKKSIEKLIQYIINNQSSFGSYKEITPRVYNVVVIKG